MGNDDVFKAVRAQEVRVNNNTSTLTAQQIRLENAGTGDTGIRFTLGSTNLIMGLDNDGGDQFQIRHSATQLGGTTGFVMNTSGNFAMGPVTPDDSARLVIGSTTSGFLPPVMTSAQMQAITTPTAGLIVYNSVSGGLYIQTSGGSWHQIVTKVA